MQKVFFEIMKQFQGEYLGSMLSGFFESVGGKAQPDADGGFTLGEAIQRGLGDAVKDNDAKFPPDWRLSKKGRGKKDAKGKRKH